MRRSNRPTRRTAILGGSTLAVWPGATFAEAEPFHRLEREVGGRLGVFALDTASRRTARWRSEERFPTASTFKALLAGVVLHRVDAKLESLNRALKVPEQVLGHSPRSALFKGQDMTVGALCAAIVIDSDNTAANLLLQTVGGPAGFTRALRRLGDPVTRLDRYELALNEALPGDPRDTTSPAAMGAMAERLLTGRVLSNASRARLVGWMVESRTGLRRIRAGAPSSWRVADKTGTGERGTTNDFAVLWPSVGAPIVMAAYLTGSTEPLAVREAALASATRAALTSLGRS